MVKTKSIKSIKLTFQSLIWSSLCNCRLKISHDFPIIQSLAAAMAACWHFSRCLGAVLRKNFTLKCLAALVREVLRTMISQLYKSWAVSPFPTCVGQYVLGFVQKNRLDIFKIHWFVPCYTPFLHKPMSWSDDWPCFLRKISATCISLKGRNHMFEVSHADKMRLILYSLSRTLFYLLHWLYMLYMLPHFL